MVSDTVSVPTKKACRENWTYIFQKNELRYSSTDVFGTAIMNAGEFSTAALYAVALIRRIS
jgi:hypothetical protein